MHTHLTRAEILVWSHLKGGRCEECHFVRKHQVGPYVLDFFAPDTGIAVEIDGEPPHLETSQEKDVARRRSLEAQGIHLLRFTNADVFRDIAGVVSEIAEAIRARRALPPPRV